MHHCIGINVQKKINRVAKITTDKMSAVEKEQKWQILPFLLDLIGFGTSWSYSAGSSEAKTALMKLSVL